MAARVIFCIAGTIILARPTEPAAFVVSSIGQSVPFILARNTLTVTLQTDSSVPRGSNFTITGLVETNSGSQIAGFPLSGRDAGMLSDGTTSAAGRWDQPTGSLSFKAGEDFLPNQEIIFSFNVINPSNSDSPEDVYIQAELDKRECSGGSDFCTGGGKFCDGGVRDGESCEGSTCEGACANSARTCNAGNLAGTSCTTDTDCMGTCSGGAYTAGGSCGNSGASGSCLCSGTGEASCQNVAAEQCTNVTAQNCTGGGCTSVIEFRCRAVNVTCGLTGAEQCLASALAQTCSCTAPNSGAGCLVDSDCSGGGACSGAGACVGANDGLPCNDTAPCGGGTCEGGSACVELNGTSLVGCSPTTPCPGAGTCTARNEGSACTASSQCTGGGACAEVEIARELMATPRRNLGNVIFGADPLVRVRNVISGTASQRPEAVLAGALNALSLEFTVSYFLPAGTAITIHGLAGARATSPLAHRACGQRLDGSGCGGVFSDVFEDGLRGSFGAWNESSKAYVVTVNRGASTEWRKFQMEFDVFNPVGDQLPPTLIIEASIFGSPVGPSLLTTVGTTVLYIFAPRLQHARVEQAIPFASAANTLTLTFSVSRDLPANSQIQLSGFDGVQVALGGNQLTRPSFTRLQDFSSDPDTGLVSVSNQRPLDSDTNHTIEFSVMNPAEPRAAAASVVISFFFTTFDSEGLYSSVGPELVPRARADLFGVQEGSSPLLTVVPAFTLAYMEQSNSVQSSHTGPRSRNQLSLRFAVNVDLPAASQLTISGLRATQTGGLSIPISSSPPVFLGQASWNQGLGQLVATSDATSISRGTVVRITFSVDNPVLAQDSPGISILARADFHGDNTQTVIGPTAVDKGAEELAPLVIDSAFLTKAIGQTNPGHNAINDIFITLAVNVALSAGDRVIVSGLEGATAPDGPVALEELNAGAQFWENGRWDEVSKALEVVAERAVPACLAAGCEHVLSFKVQNPPVAQPGPRLFVEVTGSAHVKLRVADSGPGEAAPLLVLPAFVRSSIGQSTNFPGARNTLTMTIAVNTNLEPRASSALEVSGITAGDTLDPAADRVELQACECPFAPAEYSNPNITCDCSPSVTRAAELFRAEACSPGSSPRHEGYAYWEDGLLRFFVSEETAPDAMYKVAFELVNSVRPTNESEAMITALAPPIAPVPMSVSGGGRGAPLQVLANTFVVKSIGQRTPFPGANNVLTVTLSGNVDFLADAAVFITISGLIAAKPMPTAVIKDDIASIALSTPFSSSSHPNFEDPQIFNMEPGSAAGFGAWIQCSDTSRTCNLDLPCTGSSLVLHVNQNVLAGQPMIVSFPVLNPPEERSTPASVRVAASSAANSEFIPADFMDLDTSLIPTSSPGLSPGDAAPLRVYPPSLVVRHIVQSTTRPGAVNQLSVRLATTVPLTSLSPAAQITIHGLTGALHPNGEIKLFGPDATFFDAGAIYRPSGVGHGYWDDLGKAMTLRVAASAGLRPGREYLFSFNITNPWPLVDQPTQTATVQSQRMWDVRTETMTTGLSGDGVLNVQGSRWGFFDQPGVLGIAIGQSTQAPNAMNEITLTLVSNSDLRANTSIVLSQLTGSQTYGPQMVLSRNLLDVTATSIFLSIAPSIGVGDFLLIGETEVVNVTDKESNVVRVMRGRLDTPPQPHFAGDSVRVLVPLTSSPGFLRPFAAWDQTNGVLVFSVIRNMRRDTAYSLQFELQNPKFENIPLPPTLEASIRYSAARIEPIVAPVEVPFGRAEMQPLNTLDPIFTLANLSQASSFPGVNNTIFVKMEVSIIVEGNGALIILNGFNGALDLDDNFKPIQGNQEFTSIFGNTAVWSRVGGGRLSLELRPGAQMQAFTEYQFSFQLLNPSVAQDNPVVFIQAFAVVSIPQTLMGVPAEIDQRPLYVATPQFVQVFVTQATPNPWEVNRIEVQFVVNSLLAASTGDVVVLSGLTGSGTESGDLELQDLNNNEFTSVVGDTAFFSTVRGELAMRVRNVLLPGAVNRFSFELRNPNPPSSLRPVEVFMYVNRTEAFGFVSQFVPPFRSSPAGFENCQGSRPADVCPLRVFAAGFRQRSISQSTFLPGAVNSIFVAIQVNVPATLIEICGLTGTRTPGLGTDIAFDEIPIESEFPTTREVFGNKGLWTQDGGVFILRKLKDVTPRAGEEYIFQFDVLNPFIGQAAPTLRILIEYEDVDTFTGSSRSCGQCGSCRASGDLLANRCHICVNLNPNPTNKFEPLYVEPPLFVDRIISQSTSFPGSTNIITVTLSSNIAVPVNTNSRATISGLQNSQTPDSTLFLDPTTVFGSSGSWQSEGILELDVDGNVERFRNYSFSFAIINPSVCFGGCPPPTVTVEMIGGSGVCRQERAYVQCVAGQTCRGTDNEITPCELITFAPAVMVSSGGQPPLQVDQATFLRSHIEQTSPYPGEINSITMAIASNIAFRTTDEVRIRGLTGGSLPGPALVLTSTQLVKPFAVQEFDEQLGLLILSLDGLTSQDLSETEPGFEYVFSFTLVNDLSPQNAPAISISSPNKIDWSLMTGSAMQIDSPQFILTEASQTSSFPGGRNTLRFAVALNLHLDPNTEIEVSGLFGAIATSGSVVVNARVNTFSAASQATWNDVQKALSIRFPSDITAGSEIEFSLEVRNSRSPQAAPTLRFVARPPASTLAPEARLVPTQTLTSPLLIAAPSFFVKNITQSTARPDALNFLFVTLTPAVDLDDDAWIIISGLDGAQVDGTVVPLSSTDGSSLVFSSEPGGFASRGRWEPATSSLTLYVRTSMEAERDHVFSFEVRNPTLEQASPVVQVEAWHFKLPLTAIDGDMGTSGDVGSVAGDAQPLLVRPPEFMIRKVTQSTPFPVANNVIRVDMAINVEVPCDGVRISLSGLIGSDTTSGVPPLPSATPSPLFVEDAGDGSFAATFDYAATWIQAGGVLQVEAKPGHRITPETIYQFSFEIANPPVGQPAPTVSIQLESPCYTIDPVQIETDNSPIPGILNSQSSDAFPLKVDDPAFVLRHISQTNPYPEATNALQITLAANIELREGDQVVISGLTGTRTSDGSVQLQVAIDGAPSSVFGSTGGWAQASGTLVLEVDLGLSLGAGTAVEVVFAVENPGRGQLERAVSVEGRRGAGGEVLIASMVMEVDGDRVPVGVLGAAAGDRLPLRVQAPSFVVRNIAQTSTDPGGENMLVVTLVSNLGLVSNASHPATIRLDNLVGSATLSTASLPLTWSSTSVLASNAEWESAVGRLSLYQPQVDSGVEYVFSVVLHNAGAQDPSPVHVRGIGSSTIPPAEMLSPNGQEPLRVFPPQFDVKLASQSTSFPGADNTISVTFQMNVDLSAPALISITGLQGSNTSSTGALSVQSSSNALSGSAEWTQSTGSLEVHLQQGQTIQASTEVVLQFQLRNPILAQDPTELGIVSKRGVLRRVPWCYVNRTALALANPVDQSVPMQPMSTLSTNATNMTGLNTTTNSSDHINASTNTSANRTHINETLDESRFIVCTFNESMDYVPVINLTTMDVDAAMILAGQYGSMPGDAVPLRVQQPSFLASSAHQSTSFPSAANTVTIHFVSNIELQYGDSLVLSGLIGLTAPSIIPLLPVPGGMSGHLLFSTSSSGTGTGMWTEGGTLVLIVRNESILLPNVMYALGFEVENPAAGQPGSNLKLRALGRYHFNSTVQGDEDPILLSGYQIGFKTPGFVVDPGFVVAEGVQSTPWPLANNRINVTLISSIQMDMGTVVAVDQILGASTPDSIVRVGNTMFKEQWGGSDGFGTFDNSIGEVNLFLSQDIAAGQISSFSFVVNNPSLAQDPPQLGVKTSQSIGSITVTNPGQCTGSPQLFASGGGGRQFSAVYDTQNSIVDIVDPGFGFSEAPLVSVLPGTGSCSGALFQPIMAGTQIIRRSVSSDPNAVPAGVLGVGAGDAVPLRVQDSAFVMKTMSQASALPDAANQLTVAVACNFPLVSSLGAAIVISGFPSSTFDQTLVNLMDGSGGDNTHLLLKAGSNAQPGTGSFDSGRGELALHVAADVAAGLIVTFTFDIQNPSVPRQPSALQARVEQYRIEPSRMLTDPGFTDCSVAQCLPDQQYRNSPNGPILPNYRAVLRVHSAVWFDKVIFQDSPFPATSNLLTVTLSSSIPLRAASVISISGLTGYSTDDSQTLPVSAPGAPVGIFATTGEWTQRSGTLTVEISSSTLEFTPYTLRFQLKNPPRGQHYSSSTIDLSSTGVVIPAVELERDVQALPSVDSKRGDVAPPQIRPGTFVFARASQTIPFAAAANTITVYFESNVRLFGPEVVITISGFGGASASSVVSLIPADGGNRGHEKFADPATGAIARGRWIASDEALELTVSTGQSIVAAESYGFIFEITNPTPPQQNDVLMISSSGVAIEPYPIQPDEFRILCDLSVDERGYARPLYIDEPVFEIREISQSTTFPGARNTLTISIMTNSQLSGCSISLGNLNLPAESTDLELVPGHVFSNPAGPLVTNTSGSVDLIIPANNPIRALELYSFRFRLTNPPRTNAPSAIRISACNMVSPVQMTSPSGPIPDSPGSQPGDAFPLKVDDPAFVLRHISQTNPYPEATNALQITLAANIELREGDQVVISGLTGTRTSDGSVQLQVAIDGAPSSVFGSTGGWAQASGTLVLEVDLGLSLGAGTAVEVVFAVENPGRGQLERAVSVEGRRGAGGEVLIASMVMEVDGDRVPVGVLGAAAGDRLPLRVQAPSFVVRNIGQSTTFPGQTNTLSSTLAANVRLSSAVASQGILMTGLRGATASPAPRLSCPGCLDSDIPFTAAFDATLERLTLSFKPGRVMESGITYRFDFDVTNPDQAQVAQRITLASSFNGNFEGIMDGDLFSIPNVPGAVAGDAAPLKVDDPAFPIRFAGQSVSFPSVENTITLTLVSNVLMGHDSSLYYVVLRGLEGASAVNFDALSSPFTGGTWTGAQNEVRIRVGARLDPGQEYITSFRLMNPSEPREAPLLSVGALRETEVLIEPLSIISVEGADRDPLFIQDLSFTRAIAQQDSALPASDNVVTLEFASSVSLPPNTRIVVDGFLGAEMLDAGFPAPGDLALRDASNGCNHHHYFLSVWDREQKMATLTVRSSFNSADGENVELGPTVAGKVYQMSFDLRNPDIEQYLPSISIRAEGSGALQILQTKVLCPDSTCQFCTSSVPGPSQCLFCLVNVGDCEDNPTLPPTRPFCDKCTVGAKQGDASPMNIYPLPALEYVSIGQSQHLPGLLNTLTVTIETNIVLDSILSAVVDIGNLTTLDHPSGPIPLYSDFPEEEIDTIDLICNVGDPCQLLAACKQNELLCGESTAAWDNDRKILRIYVRNGDQFPIVRHTDDRPFSFAFQLENGPRSDVLSFPTMTTHGVSQTGGGVDAVPTIAVPTGLGFTWFSVKQIGQSNPYPNQPNDLTVTLSVTQDLDLSAGAAVWITGLRGKIAAAQLNLTDPTGRNLHLMCSATFPATRLGTANWIQGDSTLFFYLVQPLTKQEVMTLRFSVRNPQRPLIDINDPPVAMSIRPSILTIPALPLDRSTVKEVPLDYDLETVLPVVGAVAGDAHPLIVYPERFTFKSIGQDTNIPRATSTITVTFATSVPLSANQTIQLEFTTNDNIESLQTVWSDTSGVVQLLPTGHATLFSSYRFGSTGSACWNSGRVAPLDNNGVSFAPTLTLYLRERTRAGQLYEFSFRFDNPGPFQRPLPVSITVKTVTDDTFREQGCDRIEILDSQGNVIEDQESLGRCAQCITFIQEVGMDTPRFEVYDNFNFPTEAILNIKQGYVTKFIRQTSSLPGDDGNKLIVDLEVNVRIIDGDQITISGLKGAQLPNPDPQNPRNVRLRTESQDTELGSAVAEWFYNTNGTTEGINDGHPFLVLTMSEEMRRRNEEIPYLVSYFIEPFVFDVLNEVLEQEAPAVHIQVSRVTGERLLPRERMSFDQSFPPLRIQPIFTLADGGQTDGAPSSRNVITITLQTNFLLPAGGRITISGFIGAVSNKGMIVLRDGDARGGIQASPFFHGAVCPEHDAVERAGMGFWCPGKTSQCPCDTDTVRRLLLTTTRDIRPCHAPSRRMDECVADRSSMVIFSIEVLNPFIANGQAPPYILVSFNNGTVDALLKTCDGRIDSTGRTALDRCPSKEYANYAPLKIFATFQCFEQAVVWNSEAPFCRSTTMEERVVASICARNQSAATAYINQTIAPILSSMRALGSANQSRNVVGTTLSGTVANCWRNLSSFCRAADGPVRPSFEQTLSSTACCSAGWLGPGFTNFVPGFPSMGDSEVDLRMCNSNAECEGLDADSLGYLSAGALTAFDTGVARLPLCCDYCESLTLTLCDAEPRAAALACRNASCAPARPCFGRRLVIPTTIPPTTTPPPPPPPPPPAPQPPTPPPHILARLRLVSIADSVDTLQLGAHIAAAVAELIGYESPQYVTVTFEDANPDPPSQRRSSWRRAASSAWRLLAPSWRSMHPSLDIGLLKVVVMNKDHMYVVANRLWSAMATGQLPQAMEEIGVTVEGEFLGEMIGIDSFGNLIDLTEYMQTPTPISACEGIEYDQELHDFFCESNYELQGLIDGEASTEAKREACEALDGCCFVAAENATTSLVDMCKSCEACHDGSWPCGPCCYPAPAEPADQGSECHEEIDSTQAWCSCEIVAPEEEGVSSQKILVYLFVAIGSFIGTGLVTKAIFDLVDKRMMRKQRERAAAFAAAQIELGFMLNEEDERGI